MVEGYKIEPEEGQRSRKGWLLLRAGANEASCGDYNSHYRRKPSRERIVVWEMERTLVRQIKRNARNWKVIEPRIYNNLNVIPAYTEQSKILVDAAGFAEYTRLRHYQQNDPNHPSLDSWIQSYKVKLYSNDVPNQANDFVAYCRPREEELKATIFILYDPRMTELFWKARIKEYAKLTNYVPIFAVFTSERESNKYRELLKAAGLRLALLDRICPLLQELEAKL